MRGERAALHNINLEIASGEHVCILGPNGCGKSTLIKTITRECYPLAREGSSISILGRERWDIFELRSLLGIVSPDLLTSCTTDATGRDVVLSGFSAAHGFSAPASRSGTCRASRGDFGAAWHSASGRSRRSGDVLG